MRCVLCECWSFQILCRACRENFLAPSHATRLLAKDLPVHSFYVFEDVEPLIHTKHTPIGGPVFRMMAKNAFIPFLDSAELPEQVHAIPIDDHVRHHYAHTAVLANTVEKYGITPGYGTLLAKSRIPYAGKPLQFRLANPRRFRYTGKKNIHAILIDDVVTTGSTLLEARDMLVPLGVNVLFALVLADVERKS